MKTPHRFVSLLLVGLSVAGCKTAAPAPAVVPPPPQLPTPTVASRWTSLQTTVLTLVAENRITMADSVLARFAREHPRTPEGDRARWWRTLLRLDTKQTGSEPAEAIAQIDSLLSDRLSADVRTEAVLMRRAVSTLDSLRRLEVRRRVQAAQSTSDRADELKATRDSIARLNTELERLRRRLRAP